MLHLEAERPLKQHILIADTVLTESDPDQVLRFRGAKYNFKGKYFCFYHMFKTNFSEHNEVCGAQKRFGGTASE